jgi:hypothetical protein
MPALLRPALMASTAASSVDDAGTVTLAVTPFIVIAKVSSLPGGE